MLNNGNFAIFLLNHLVNSGNFAIFAMSNNKYQNK